MPPKIDQTKINHPVQHPPVKPTPKPTPKPLPRILPDKPSATTRKADFSNYGTQQKDRIEKAFEARLGASTLSLFNDARLAKATTKANFAFSRTYKSELS
jgi:hypothetical protein